MWQFVECHVAVTEDNPHHGEGAQASQTIDNIWIIGGLDGENLRGIGQNGEGHKQGLLGFCN